MFSASKERDSRPFDLVVFGATGFTGRLVAEQVARRAPKAFRWALAGRRADGLRDLAAALRSSFNPPSAEIVADALDVDAMRDLASSARVVLSTVGPYGRYGTPLVDACADLGTDYADLTAEVTWMRGNIDRLHDRAVTTGARIVHAAGFDSVPSDLGVWLLQCTAMSRWGTPCREVVHLFGPMSGGVSGGTIQSGLDLLRGAVQDPAMRKALQNPELLAPGGTPSGDAVGPWWPLRHHDLDRWSAPFVMAAANSKVVRRTRHLLGEPWGDASYLERVGLPTWARAATVGVATAATPLALSLAPVRSLVQRWLPKPGEGPSQRVRDRGFFKSLLVGTHAETGATLRVSTSADSDPGYGATACMLAEMGLHLATVRNSGLGGILTPAIAGGDAYLARLAEVGVRIEVVPDAP